MADEMKPTPRSPILGLFSDIVNLPLQYMSSPERTQQMQGTAEFLYGTGIPKTLERMSYGDSLFSGAGGLGGTTRMRPETADALMNVAPLAPAVAKGGKAVARMAGSEINAAMMGERGGLLGAVTPQPMFAVNLPKSISGRIGNITPESKTEVKNLAETFAEEINKLGFSAKVEHSGSKAGASSYINVSDPLTGRFLSKPIRISDHSKGAKESQRVIDILNPQDDFKKITDALSEMRGMGETLVFKQNKYADELIASGVKPKTAYQKAKTEITETQPSFQYPREQALKLAQQRAALPVSEGGLGLPANNTPMDRARAMGFGTDFAHGSPQSNITKFEPSKTGEMGGGIYATNYFPEADIYAGKEIGATTYPLKVKTNTAYQAGEENPYMKLIVSDDEQLQKALQRMGKESIIKTQQPPPDWLKALGTMDMPIREHFVSMNPDLFRSRFAAFDPFRKDVATATAMGVALPDLLAQPVNQYQPTYETTPMYTDPFGNTIGSSIR